MTVHVIGAGLAGLAAAVALRDRGVPVTVLEATKHAGGRCRSWVDPVLGPIDNGAHVVLATNRAVASWLDRLGTKAEMAPLAAGGLPFFEPATGTHWVHAGTARALFDHRRRVPGVGLLRYVRDGARLAWAERDATVRAVLGGSPLFEPLWRPVAVAALNTPVEAASARLLWQTLLATRGTITPLIARESLGQALIAPAIARLAADGADIRFGARVSHFVTAGNRIAAIGCAGTTLPVRDVILATGPEGIPRLLPQLDVPTASHAIINLHALLPAGVRLPSHMLGLIGGTAEWVFQRGRVLTITVSAADRLVDLPSDAIARRLWPDVEAVLGIALPADVRVVKERRATFAATPGLHRPGPRDSGFQNLVLAGDWTATGFPATIEGALTSGARAAALIRSS